MLISPLGGSDRILAETRDVTPAMWDSSGSLSWSPDGKYLAVLDKSSPAEPVGIFLLSVDTGEKRRLTQPPPKIVGDSGPAFSPDGRMLAFTRSTGIVVNDLYVVHLSSAYSPEGEPKRLTFDNKRTYNPAWMPDGQEIIFSSSRAGPYSLWRMPAKGGAAPLRLESVGEDGFYPAVARQGHGLVYTRSWTDMNIWRIELPDAPASRLAPEGLKSSLLIASSRSDGAPRVSPDGKRIVFVSDRSGFYEIWIADSSGLNQVQLTSLASYSGSPTWSPDGGQISFDCNQAGHFEVYAMSANGGRPRRLTNGSADNSMPQWSRDGKWIYFRSIRSGETQVWKMPAAGGEPIQVTKKGGFGTAESVDGATLYYTKTDQVSGLWGMPVSGGDETRILEAVKARSFAVAKDGIYFFAPGPSGGTLLQFHNFSTGRATTLGPIEKPVFLYLDVSPDRRWLVYSQRDQQVEDLMLVENFR
jgi:Tol biopolymer transport system component